MGSSLATICWISSADLFLASRDPSDVCFSSSSSIRASQAVAGDFCDGHQACCAPELSQTFFSSRGSSSAFAKPKRPAS